MAVHSRVALRLRHALHAQRPRRFAGAIARAEEPFPETETRRRHGGHIRSGGGSAQERGVVEFRMSMGARQFVLTLEGVNKTFEGFKAISALNFYVDQSELRVVIGP